MGTPTHGRAEARTDADAMTSLRVGIAGCGRLTADHHLPAIGSLSEIEAVALADPDEERLAAVAGRFGIRGRYATAAEMLGRERLDLVCVAVPPRAHADVALEAARHGVPVLVEKPLALDLEEAGRIVESVRAAGVPGYCGFNLRCHRLVEEAARVIRRHELGDLRAVRSVLTSALRLEGVFPGWRAAAETGGGALSELAVHHLDLWTYVTGQPVVRVAVAFGNEPFAEETVAVSAELEGGTVVSAAFCQGTRPVHEIEVYGEKAQLRLDLYRTDGLEIAPWDRGPGGIASRLQLGARSAITLWGYRRQIRAGGLYRESFVRHWQAVAAALQRAATPPSTLEDGLRAQRVLAAARRSALNGSWEAVT